MLSSKETSVLRVLLKLSSYFGKRYSFAAQKTIVRLCEEWYGEKMCRRTLNRVLASLEVKGFFGRTRRHLKKPSGELLLRSTLYKLCSKAFGWLWSLKGFFNEVAGGFAVTKVAQHFSLRKEDHPHPVDNWVRDDNLLPKGAPSAVFRRA